MQFYDPGVGGPNRSTHPRIIKLQSVKIFCQETKIIYLNDMEMFGVMVGQHSSAQCVLQFIEIVLAE